MYDSVRYLRYDRDFLCGVKTQFDCEYGMWDDETATILLVLERYPKKYVNKTVSVKYCTTWGNGKDTATADDTPSNHSRESKKTGNTASGCRRASGQRHIGVYSTSSLEDRHTALVARVKSGEKLTHFQTMQVETVISTISDDACLQSPLSDFTCILPRFCPLLLHHIASCAPFLRHLYRYYMPMLYYYYITITVDGRMSDYCICFAIYLDVGYCVSMLHLTPVRKMNLSSILPCAQSH